MTLDELTQLACEEYRCCGDMRVAVLAVLDAVKRECVPTRRDADPESTHYDYDAGYNVCLAEMLRRLAEMTRTPWFPVGTPPVRKGWYEVMCWPFSEPFEGCHHWDGTRWTSTDGSVSIFGRHPKDVWRGLTKPAEGE